MPPSHETARCGGGDSNDWVIEPEPGEIIISVGVSGISKIGLEVIRVNERDNQSGENVTLKIGANGGRRLFFSGTTKDNPSREDIKEMLDRIYANATVFFSNRSDGGAETI